MGLIVFFFSLKHVKNLKCYLLICSYVNPRYIVIYLSNWYSYLLLFSRAVVLVDGAC